jgi:hypothetical protein
MISYIDEYKDRFGVEPISRVSPIAPSTYYEMKAVEGMLGLKYEDMMYEPSQEKYLTKAEYSRSLLSIQVARWSDSIPRDSSGCRIGSRRRI